MHRPDDLFDRLLGETEASPRVIGPAPGSNGGELVLEKQTQ